jgi:hypothetical protein
VNTSKGTESRTIAVVTRRGELLAMAGILAAAGVIVYVGLVVVASALTGCSGWTGASCPPQGTALALGSPTVATAHGAYWYNFSVASAGGGVTAGATQWEFVTAVGSDVAPGPTWTLQLLNLAGSVVSAYELAHGVWEEGGNVALQSGFLFTVYSANTSLSGDHAEISGSGAYAGTISVAID